MSCPLKLTELLRLYVWSYSFTVLRILYIVLYISNSIKVYFWIRNWFHRYSSCSSCRGGHSSKSLRLCRFKSDRHEIWQIVLKYTSIDGSRFSIWRHTLKTTDIRSYHPQKPNDMPWPGCGSAAYSAEVAALVPAALVPVTSLTFTVPDPWHIRTCLFTIPV